MIKCAFSGNQREVRPMNASIIEHFAILEDPRIERHKKHKLVDIIVLAICAVLSGAEGWEAIEEYGHAKLAWLRKFIPLENGVPTHDTIARVLSGVSAKGLQECFLNWVKAVQQATDGQVVAIDGKRVRRSLDWGRGKKAIHMVSAWGSANGLVLGQLKTDAKSNEITALPQLLELLELKGCIVTLDAMGCQTEIAEKIIEKGADYVLAVKGNQGHLYEAIVDFFETAPRAHFRDVPFDYHEETEGGHGRIEVRRYWTTPVLTTLPQASQWADLKIIGRVEAERHLGDKLTVERRYYIASLKSDARQFGQAVRGHWGIENSLHWVLDVTLREDECRIRRGEAAENFCTLRHFAFNLLKQEKTLKKSLKQKRLKAGWDDTYRAKVLFG
jgi:predicted transposase YbfD/YdcC